MRKLQDAECEATEEAKSSRRCGTKRRTRAAEVHNLSERVRSDYTSQSYFQKESLSVYCSYRTVIDWCSCREEETGSMKKCAPCKSWYRTATRYIMHLFLSGASPLINKILLVSGDIYMYLIIINMLLFFFFDLLVDFIASNYFQTDKASILDETIEYLKSLQMQVQVRSYTFLDLHDPIWDHLLVPRLRKEYVSDHVDDFWDGTDDVSWCSSIHVTNGSRHEFSLRHSDVIHEPSPAKSHPFELISNYESN